MKFKSVFSLLLFFCTILFGNTKKYSSIEDNIAYAKKILIEEQKGENIFKVLFCPAKEPDAKKVLLGLIYNEKKSICLAQFVLNDKEIAEALIHAKQQGVKVSLISDRGNLDQKNQKITLLKEHNIAVQIYKKMYSIMHHKYYIFSNNFFDKPIVWMGSANATFFGFKKNQESVAVFNDENEVNAFKNEFKRLREQILQYSNEKMKSIQAGVNGLIEKKNQKKYQRIISAAALKIVTRK